MMSHDFVAVATVQETRCDVMVYYIIFSDFMTFYFYFILRTFVKTLKTLEHFCCLI